MLLGVLHRGLPEVVKSGRHFLAAESVELETGDSSS